LIEYLLVKANRIPVPLIDSFSAMMNAKAILAANELGLFTALEEKPLSARELAGRLKASERGVADLSDALCAGGYLEREGEEFRLTAMSRKWLVLSSRHYIGNMLEHVNDLWNVWLNLEEAVRKGAPPRDDYQDWLTQEDHRQLLRRHIVGLRDMAKLTAPELIRSVKLSATSKRLLDVGGGHGGYSVAFCRKYPHLSATVFDLGPTSSIGREVIEREGMSERVRFQVGDFLSDDLGSGYDAALYFNIVHNFSEDDNRRVLRKVFDALAPGGRIAVWDMFKEPGGERDALPALMALHMMVASGGTSYLIDEVEAWLSDAGFAHPTRKTTRTAPGLTLLLARKP
jgi:ubiquinone/menaquinone biosynthesis C-methylase UbiE